MALADAAADSASDRTPLAVILGTLLLPVGRAGILLVLIVEAAIGTDGSSAATAGTSKPGFPASPWPTGSPYPAGVTEYVPGQSGDEADIVSAPLPAGMSYTGVSDLLDATASYAATMLGTWFSAHSDTVLANHSLGVCGRHAWLAEVRVRYTKEELPDETVAIVVLDLGGGRRPGTLFVDVPDVMDPGVVGTLTQSVRPATGC